MAAVLKIVTDNSATGVIGSINLLDPFGFMLKSWRPAILPVKDGGIVVDSPLADFRHTVYYHHDNAIESMVLTLNASSQDGAISKMRQLFAAMQQARDYWTMEGGPSHGPVRLVAKSANETNERWCYITAISIPEVENPYGQPFIQKDGQSSTSDEIAVIIEHTAWHSDTESLLIGVKKENNSRYYGNVTIAGVNNYKADADEVFVGNFNVNTGITHCYASSDWTNFIINSSSGFSFPIDLFVEDPSGELYFGSRSSLNGIPFFSLVFDIGTVADLTDYTTEWQYYNGSTWAAMPVRDQTDDGSGAFTVSGVNTVTWEAIPSWTPCNLQTLFGGAAPNFDAFYIRLQYTSSALNTSPTQVNRNVYTVNWNYVDVNEQVGGDIDSLARIILRAKSGEWDDFPYNGTNKVYMGVRSVGRGTEFSMTLNCDDNHNPSGITYSDGSGTVENSNHWPARKRSKYIAGAATSSYLDISSWTLDNTIAGSYVGKFRLLAIIGASSGVADDEVCFRSYSSVGTLYLLHVGEPVNFRQSSVDNQTPKIVDLGDISIPDDEFGGIRIAVQLKLLNATASDEIYCYGIHLVPVDEWCGLYYGSWSVLMDHTGGGSGIDLQLDLDATRSPKRTLCYVRDVLTDEVYDKWVRIQNGSPGLTAGASARLWVVHDFYDFNILSIEEPQDTRSSITNPGALSGISISQQRRYFSSRGSG